MLLWKDSWGEIGVPAIITTDRDPRFVSSFFTTICALSGCRVVFSQAHRPQANGRAESAGKVIRDIMRKLFLEEARSWVLLLPLAIRIRHDTIDPELGFFTLSAGLWARSARFRIAMGIATREFGGSSLVRKARTRGTRVGR